MVADADGTYDGTVDAYAGIVAYGHVAYCIVDATVGLDDAVAPQAETTVGWGVHPHAVVDL